MMIFELIVDMQQSSRFNHIARYRRSSLKHSVASLGASTMDLTVFLLPRPTSKRPLRIYFCGIQRLTKFEISKRVRASPASLRCVIEQDT